MAEKTKIDRQKLLREIQLTQLKSLHKLDQICQKYGIQYWAHAGTLLGAVRHKGFIPWDDDIDLGMMREDFEKLCRVPAQEWEPECFFCGPSSDEVCHDKFFGRVYVKGTRIQSYRDVADWRNWEDAKSWSTSLMCDIFVYDRVPDDEKTRQILYKDIRSIAAQKYKIVKCKPHTDSKSPAKRLKTALKTAYGTYMRRKFKRPWKYLDYYAKRKISEYPRGERIGCYCNDTGNLPQPRENYFPLQELPFEDMKIPVPRNYDALLTQWYGEYMTPPPDSDKIHIDFIYVDLGDGRKYVLDPIKGSLGNP